MTNISIDKTDSKKMKIFYWVYMD